MGVVSIDPSLIHADGMVHMPAMAITDELFLPITAQSPTPSWAADFGVVPPVSAAADVANHREACLK
jgi:hypothetical protein